MKIIIHTKDYSLNEEIELDSTPENGEEINIEDGRVFVVKNTAMYGDKLKCLVEEVKVDLYDGYIEKLKKDISDFENALNNTVYVAIFEFKDLIDDGTWNQLEHRLNQIKETRDITFELFNLVNSPNNNGATVAVYNVLRDETEIIDLVKSICGDCKTQIQRKA